MGLCGVPVLLCQSALCHCAVRLFQLDGQGLLRECHHHDAQRPQHDGGDEADGYGRTSERADDDAEHDAPHRPGAEYSDVEPDDRLHRGAAHRCLVQARPGAADKVSN